MENHQELPKYLRECLHNLGYEPLRTTSPTTNAFCVEITPIKTSSDISSDKNLKPRKVFIKCLASSDLSSDFQADLYFSNEVTFYSRLLTNFKQMEAAFESTVDVPFTSVPECILADESCVILEDLFASGHVPLEITAPLTYASAKVVLQQLARFHAFSLALRHHRPGVFARVLGDLHGTDETTRRIFAEGLQDALKLAKASFPKSSVYVEKLALFVFETYRNAEGADSPRTKTKTVITHGDLWPNNILLKRTAEDRAETAKFVDFQGCRPASWVNDLMAVVLIALDKRTRDEHREDLLECYRCAACVKLEELEVPEVVVDESFGEDNFRKELRTETRHAMATALAGLPLYLQSGEAHRDEESEAGAGEDPVVVYFRTLRSRKSMRCKNKMLEIIMECVDQNYLD